MQYQDHAEIFTRPVGHGIYSAVVEEFTGAVRSMTLEKLQQMHLSGDQLREQALHNLEGALKSGVIGSTEYPNGPHDKPFILVGGHWAASACCILPLMPDLARKKLGSEDLCFSIPHTYALLIFAKGDRNYREAMRALVREKESDGRKPLTFELFEYKGQSVVPFVEGNAD